MNASPHDEPNGKPVLRRPASGGGVIISSTPTNTSQTNKKAAYGKGGTSSLPGGSSLRVQRQQHQHRSLWMTCSRCLCGTRAEEWESKLRQFLVGELPASLSLPTKFRIVLEVSMGSVCVWVVGGKGTFLGGGGGRRAWVG